MSESSLSLQVSLRGEEGAPPGRLAGRGLGGGARVSLAQADGRLGGTVRAAA